MKCSECIHFKRCLRLGTLLSEGTIDQAEQFCENFEKKDDDDKIDSICRNAINRFGIDSQLNVAVEEMSELIKELCKYKRYSNNKDAILEELADCCIMFRQIGFIFEFSEHDIKEAIEAKAKRLEGRMKENV